MDGSTFERSEFRFECSILELIFTFEAFKSVTGIVWLLFGEIKCKICRDREKVLKSSQLKSAADRVNKSIPCSRMSPKTRHTLEMLSVKQVSSSKDVISYNTPFSQNEKSATWALLLNHASIILQTGGQRMSSCPSERTLPWRAPFHSITSLAVDFQWFRKPRLQSKIEASDGDAQSARENTVSENESIKQKPWMNYFPRNADLRNRYSSRDFPSGCSAIRPLRPRNEAVRR